jgi:hypothetical protein
MNTVHRLAVLGLPIVALVVASDADQRPFGRNLTRCDYDNVDAALLSETMSRAGAWWFVSGPVSLSESSVEVGLQDVRAQITPAGPTPDGFSDRLVVTPDIAKDLVTVTGQGDLPVLVGASKEGLVMLGAFTIDGQRATLIAGCTKRVYGAGIDGLADELGTTSWNLLLQQAADPSNGPLAGPVEPEPCTEWSCLQPYERSLFPSDVPEATMQTLVPFEITFTWDSPPAKDLPLLCSFGQLGWNGCVDSSTAELGISLTVYTTPDGTLELWWLNAAGSFTGARSLAGIVPWSELAAAADGMTLHVSADSVKLTSSP